MPKFAKIFEIGEEQLLIVNSISDLGHPEVIMFTEIGFMMLSITATFEPKSNRDVDTDEAKASAQTYYNSLIERDAEALREGIINHYKNHYLESSTVN